MSAQIDMPKAAGFPAFRGLTPILAVSSVTDCLPCWTERLGFEITTTVPGDADSLAFAILRRGGVEIMYQSHASVLADGHMSAADLRGHSVALFLEVESIDAVERAIAGAPVVKARHDTFYGSTEIYVKEPGGNIVGFAQMK